MSSFLNTVLLSVCLCSCTAYADTYRDQSTYIEQIPVSAENYDFEKFSDSDAIVVELHGVSASRFQNTADSPQTAVIDATDRSITIKVDRNALIDEMHFQEQQGSYRDSTFVLDYEEESIQLLLDDLDAEVNGNSTVLNTVKWVDSKISIKNRKRGFDIASTVAITGEGDCTEHSVLLGAVARGLGYPAKVVFGVVIIGFQEHAQAFGHAWNEVYVDGRWQLADAALYGLQFPKFYLPTGTLDNEGPGFALSLVQSVSNFPQNIILK